MNSKAASSGSMSNKKASKGVFYGFVSGSFSQKKKASLGNVKHSGDEKDISLKSGSSASVYSDVESLSGDDEDVSMSGGFDGSLLNSVVNTSRAKRVNTSVNFGSLIGSLDFEMNKEVKSMVLGGATTPSKFEEIIQLMFTSEKSMRKAVSLAEKEEIVVNNNVRKQEFYSDQAVVIKEIPMDTSKDMIIAAVFEFGQLAAKWSFLIGKNSVRVAKAVGDHETWAFRDQYRALLFTLPVGTMAHDLGDLLAGAVCCVVVCFENDEALESAFCTKPIFGKVKLSWARLNLVWCSRCEKFGHLVLECDDEITSVPKPPKPFMKWVTLDENCLQLAKLYAKKSVPISCPAAFGSKLWTQVISSASVSSGFSTGSSSSLSSSSGSGSGSLSPSTLTLDSALDGQLSSLKRSLGLLLDQVSCIIKRLNGAKLVLLASILDEIPTVSDSQPLASVPSVVVFSNFPSDMVLDGSDGLSDTPLPTATVNLILGLSGSKVLTSKLGSLESKFVRSVVCWLGVIIVPQSSMTSFVWKIATCNVRGMNNPAKQANIIHWHMSINNMVSIVTEMKLKGKVRPWIADKFAGVQVFISGLDLGHLGLGVAIVMNTALARHVCRVSEVSGCLLSVRLLFKNKLSVSILGLYAGALASVHFSQTDNVNALIARAVNEFSFIVLGGDFNEDGSCGSTSFKKCSSLGLVNSLVGSVTKTIDYFFVSPSLINAIVGPVSVSIGLGGLLDTCLCSVCKQANKNHWKYNFKNADVVLWLKFKDATAVNAAMFSDDFMAARQLLDLDAMWDAVCKTMCFLVDEVFKKNWFKDYDGIFTKSSSKFHKLELLVSKLVKASRFVNCDGFISLLDTWALLDSSNAVVIRSLFLSGSPFDIICSALSKTRKSYRASKLSELKRAEDSQIRSAIDKRMESFESTKGHTIRSVLERPFHRVVLDHLVIGDKLYLEPDPVKTKVDKIMKGWICTHKVVLNILGDWSHQYQPLEYIFDGAFSDVMSCVSFVEMFDVVSSLLDEKAAGLLGISNELWKHYNKSVLDMLLDAWVSIIPKLYEWEGVLMNTHPIVLIEMARKILSKIFSDRISLPCSKFDVFYEDNFSVLKDTMTQSPIFAIGSVIEDALKKNQKLWLVLQDMRKAYDLKSLVRIKMCSKFIRFFGDIYGGRTNQVMTDFGLTKEEVFSPLLWCIFYDPLLCEVKRQENVCDYRLISCFVTKMGCMESQTRLSFFFAAGAFVDDTIWVSNSQAATQHILNVASEFFCINDISINNDKTIAILINCRIRAPSLFISGSSIFIAKSGESHCYPSIFLSSEGLLKPSLAKAHSDVCFFTNLVLRKAMSDKQFLYLVLAVLYPIISYKTQFSFVPVSVCNKWDSLVCKGLKSKSRLLLDFPNDTIHYPSFYGLKFFAQIQSKSKVTSLISFANSTGILGFLFSHRSHDLQVLCWCPVHPLSVLVHVRVSPLNNFLAGVVCIFLDGNLSLSGVTEWFSCYI
ncbi:hypothetical protein G9A89_023551 [Geosiphon pyriformis]|nr:hypothetical protein G9A89_023551 [Geosiphon pyriformis]